MSVLDDDAAAKKARAERVIGTIRTRAFKLLAEYHGELEPLALTLDDAGRLGVVASYNGHDYPRPDEALVALQTELRILGAQGKFDAAATAHVIRISLPVGGEKINAVCVQYEARDDRPVKVYFPYNFRRRLIGNSEVDPREPITQRGNAIIFRTADNA